MAGVAWVNVLREKWKLAEPLLADRIIYYLCQESYFNLIKFIVKLSGCSLEPFCLCLVVAKRTVNADVPTQSTLCSFISSVPLFQNNNLTTQDHESIIVVSTFLSKSEDKYALFDNASVNACLCPSEVGQIWKHFHQCWQTWAGSNPFVLLFLVRFCPSSSLVS